MVDLLELFMHFEAGRSQVQISESLGLDRKTVRKYLAPAVAEGIGLGVARVMLSDALTSQQAAGSAPESVEVVDVAQMLLAAVRRGTPA